MMKSQRFNPALRFAVAVCLFAGCERSGPEPAPDAAPKVSATPSVTAPQSIGQEVAPCPIVTAARSQIGKTTTYDPAYVRLVYPGGDIPVEKGVCTDVVIRALRDAFDMDLQKLIHEDMKTAFSEYPNIWGLKKPDRNIDHRRVPNLRRYFERKGFSVGMGRQKNDYLAGDLVTCTVGAKRPHIMIVSDKKTRADVPFVIHNIGSGAREEDRLFDFPITGHYRIKAEKAVPAR
jgi:uncharacterized protein YijF (DUF1287 family)